MAKKSVGGGWTERDSVLWHTCEIAVDLATGVPPRPRLDVRAPFPSQLAPDELYWSSGRFDLLEERAVGDGTYIHNGGFFFATGAVGLGATAALAGLQALGNHSRRVAAEAAAVPRWVPIDGGNLYVSPSGLHLHTASAVHPWAWTDVTAMQVVAPGAVHLLGRSLRGDVAWILRSDWAELAFVAWALTCHRRHPQLVGGAWLPPGWLARAAEHQYPVRLPSPAISS